MACIICDKTICQTCKKCSKTLCVTHLNQHKKGKCHIYLKKIDEVFELIKINNRCYKLKSDKNNYTVNVLDDKNLSDENELDQLFYDVLSNYTIIDYKRVAISRL